ncbi:tetratricopeptide repeat-containing sulfotransferase family protein [Thalassomonas sp. M1454]|uniref:tetratricopeptide repeat-containing sulfotransferase family protein n=1 Tax=Thalassomonas sp. M1454 TaxID=2594477 RepID=UPI00117DDF2C|nr:tetratricopeptide repeat-containing sulfotransferase family protein [Thalassomonas sp. M1454]TRX56759.1 tetratricopeptide repeat protein [Thalassomonas sp. M1454]
MTPDVIRLLEQGFALQQQGNLQGAETLYLKVLKQDKNNQFALNLLGVVCINKNDNLQAESYLQRALQVNDKDPETYSNLGLVYKEQKRFPQALQMFERSLQLNPKQPQTLNNLGNVLASINQHDKAVYCFDSALKIDNRYLDCINNLTQSLKALSQFDKAIQVSEYALKIDPKRSDSLNNLGEIYNALTEYKMAKSAFERAIAIDGNIVAKINLSTSLKQLGLESQALALLNEVIAIEENNSEALNHLGVLHEQLGNFDLAAKHFRLSIKHTPNHASSFYQLSKLKQQRLSAVEITKLKQLIADDSQIDLFKFSYYLALACEFDKAKDYQQAITYFIKGKALKAKTNPFDASKNKDYLASNKTVFSQLNNSGQQAESTRTAKQPVPIFIVGMPRSGTTLTEQILASHNDIVGTGELGFINDIAKQAVKLTNTPYPQCINKLNAKQLNELRELYLAKVTERFDVEHYFVDKNPLNYNSLGFIALVFPEAKFIYCKRDAMDNCISIFKLPFDDNQTYSHDLTALGEHYLHHLELMNYWQQVFLNRILTVNYEETVADVESQIKRVMAFIGLDYQESMLNFYQNKRIVMTPSAEQVRQPIYASSVGSWQRYGDALTPLISALNYSPK